MCGEIEMNKYEVTFTLNNQSRKQIVLARTQSEARKIIQDQYPSARILFYEFKTVI
jgi:hypothetical protein